MDLSAPRSAALLAGLAALLVAAPAADAAWPGLNGRIVNAQRAPADVPGEVQDLEILAWAPDGASFELTHNLFSDTQPTWAPDGRRVAFRTSRFAVGRAQHEQVMVINADGSGERRVAHDDNVLVFSTQPAFSPDGQWIIFRSNQSTLTRKADVFSMDLDGNDVVQLTNTPVFDERYPTLSPDGTKLLFASDRGGTWGIWVANADGSDPYAVYDGPVHDRAPAWSPDGTQIAFESWTTENGDGDVFVMNADGSNVHSVVAGPAHEEGPAWSPDGSRLAFTSEADGDSDTWIVNADGSGEPRNYTASDRYEESPDWQPLPYTNTGHGPCGDVSTAPGGASGVVAVKAPCDTALRVALRFTTDAGLGAPPDKVEGYECTRAPHTYDQVVVECDHEGIKKGLAFVWREAAAAEATALRMSAGARPDGTGAPDENAGTAVSGSDE